MASSLSLQLSKIAANSTHSLNVKAQKASHSQSLIFEARVAASQSFDSIYTLCHEGFQELCLLDGRFLEFQKDIFSDQSKEEDRTQMTATQNSELDKRIEAFLGLVGGRLRLTPAVKSVEWLIRRFRIQKYNTSFLLTTFLPYHTLPVFTTLLSILPSNIPPNYRFLHPYIRSLTQPPRHVIVYTAKNNPAFASSLNAYVLRIANARQHYPALLSFWAGVMTEAVSGMLEKSRSGRQGVQVQNEQDIALQLLPSLNEGLAMKKVPELRIGCYMLLSILASKGGLEDNLLNAMMEAVVMGWTRDTYSPGLICLSILAQNRGAKQLTRRLTKELLKVRELPQLLFDISKQRSIDRLANGFCLALIERSTKTGDPSLLSIVEYILKNGLLNDAQTAVAVKALLLNAYRLDDSVDINGSIRAQLAKSLTSLGAHPGHTGIIVRGAMEDSGVDMDELEMKIKAVIRPKTIPASQCKDMIMEDTAVGEAVGSVGFNGLVSLLPKHTSVVTSFLSHSKSHIFGQLCEAFVASVSIPEHIKRFDSAPILRRGDAVQEMLYFTFYMRVWCSPQPVLARVAALRMAAERLKSVERSTTDFQALIPYAAVALSDPAAKVRGAAAELTIAISELYPADGDVRKLKESLKQWGFDSIYGSGKEVKVVKWLPVDHAVRFLREILLPALEECVLDRTHLQSLFDMAFNGSKSVMSSHKNESSRLPQTLRASILNFLGSHVINSPLYLVKLRLLSCLTSIRGVASTTRTKILLPVLQHWARLKPAETQEYVEAEGIDEQEFDDAAVTVVVPNDAEGLECFASIVKGEISTDRPKLVAAVFRRIRTAWKSLKGDMRIETAQLLMDVSQWPAGEAGASPSAQQEAIDVLQTVPISTDILLSFLNQLPTAAKLADTPPATKRRRVSHGEVARAVLQDAKLLKGAIQKVTFVLQLIDSSNPRKHTALLGGLFNALAELQHFKVQVGSELGYLQSLILSSLLEIMSAYKSDRALKLNPSAVRPDLLVDCVQKTASPQVQNAALLLIASLAEIAPELILHSVMPIFTFMGSSVLRQNDEYSAHVIKQTIAKVIPPLIESLRKRKGNHVTGAAELLLSFVAAYEHVPAHRRKGLFISLVRTLGPEDFLFAFLGMLSEKYGVTDDIKSFAADLSNVFKVDIQLQTAVKYIDLVGDILTPKPTLSNVLLSSSDSVVRDPPRMALNQLTLLSYLLSQRRLIDQMGKILQHDDMDASRARELYSTLLENLLALAATAKNNQDLHRACGDVLGSLLGLLSTSDFIKAIESLLDRPNDELRRKILRSVEVRIDRETQSDTQSRLAMLNFLPQLTAIIRESGDIVYKHTAVSCVDKISEKYGKKDLEAVAAAAETIVSEHCLGQKDGRLRVMALLCLASLLEILRDGIIPVLPIAINKALDYVEESIDDEVDTKLHNAGYAFLSALVGHLPYMMTGEPLERLLAISNDSAEAKLDEEADENRRQCLQITAKQVEAKTMFLALQHKWKDAADSGELALREYLDVLNIAIDKHPKFAITQHSAILSAIFLDAFDLRRQWSLEKEHNFSIEALGEIENTVNSVAIKMIYKFNDSTFRPIFAKLIEWASSALPKKDKIGRTLRLQSVYAFLAHFFSRLKSIVTSYATYLLDSVVEILQTVAVKDEESKELWAKAIKTLVECFKHDQDEFWQSPVHFDAIAPALTGQFLHASSLSLTQGLIPAIVELAAAADSADHHKYLSTAILKHMRSESAAVRLAAVMCEQALTDRLGEEWLSMLPEMLPFISELQEDDDEVVERETHRWIVKIEGVLGESLDSMLQ